VLIWLLANNEIAPTMRTLNGFRVRRERKAAQHGECQEFTLHSVQSPDLFGGYQSRAASLYMTVALYPGPFWATTDASRET